MADSPQHEAVTAIRKIAKDVEDGQIEAVMIVGLGNPPRQFSMLPGPGERAITFLGMIDNAHAAVRSLIAQQSVAASQAKSKIVAPSGVDRAVVEKSKR